MRSSLDSKTSIKKLLSFYSRSIFSKFIFIQADKVKFSFHREENDWRDDFYSFASFSHL